jgi:hypothetical protein
VKEISGVIETGIDRCGIDDESDSRPVEPVEFRFQEYFESNLDH